MPDDLTPAQPLRPVAQTPGGPAPLSWRRPLLLALLVLIVGAALGAVAFAAEQRAFVWRPEVEATPAGEWLVTGAQGLRPASPALATDRLIWGQGAYTCVLELDSGDTHVVGAAPRGSSVWAPAAGEHYVAWIEVPRAAVGDGRLWVYDIEKGRRQHLSVGREAATPAVAGKTVAWYDERDDGTPYVETLDMDTGRRTVLATGAVIEYPVLGGDGVVGWISRAGGGVAVVLHELTSHVETTVPLAGSGTRIGDVQLAGRTLLWTLTSAADTRVVSFDLDSRATSILARGVVTTAATDGAQVVWTSGASTSDQCVVRGRPIDGGADQEVARPATWPKSLAVGSGWVAWVLDDGDATRLEALPVAR